MKKKKKNENSSKIFEYHDHGACFGDSITQIEDYFIQKKLQLTPLRRKVFEILIEDHKPLGAYDILDKLGEASATSILVLNRNADVVERNLLDIWLSIRY